jgi:hypothetical protein
MIKLKTATLWAAILWVLIFVEVSIAKFTPGLSGNDFLQKIIEIILVPIFVLLCAYMYFNGEKASVKDGLMLAAWFLVIGTILDLAITVPLFLKSFTALYSQWNLWVGYIEAFVVCALYGYLKK